jgi:predicted flap endonuclease-1-like 5' DNA nuclease
MDQDKIIIGDVDMPKIVEIEGIGPTFAKKLSDVGVSTVEELLEKGASEKGRLELSKKTGIQVSFILKWVNRADLFRIKGIGEQYSDLLEVAGVDTVVELSRRNAENLHAKLEEINTAKNLVNKLPSLNQVSAWIEAAKTLPRVVNY